MHHNIYNLTTVNLRFIHRTWLDSYNITKNRHTTKNLLLDETSPQEKKPAHIPDVIRARVYFKINDWTHSWRDKGEGRG